MSEIVIVYAFLETLELQVRTTVGALTDGSHLLDVEFGGNPEVTWGYGEFLGRWNEHRAELITGLTAAADAIAAVRDSFVAIEDELVAALGEG